MELVAQEPENAIALIFTIGPDNPLRNASLDISWRASLGSIISFCPRVPPSV